MNRTFASGKKKEILGMTHLPTNYPWNSNQSIIQSIDRSFTQSINQSIIDQSIHQTINQSIIDQSINQSINQSSISRSPLVKSAVYAITSVQPMPQNAITKAFLMLSSPWKGWKNYYWNYNTGNESHRQRVGMTLDQFVVIFAQWSVRWRTMPDHSGRWKEKSAR